MPAMTPLYGTQPKMERNSGPSADISTIFTQTTTPGLLLLHGAGNVFTKELDEGQEILIKPTSLLFLDTTVQMQLHFEMQGGPSTYVPGYGPYNARYVWLRLTGPGRIAVRSAFKETEDNLLSITGSSPATWDKGR